jgi:hypothetical protein
MIRTALYVNVSAVFPVENAGVLPIRKSCSRSTHAAGELVSNTGFRLAAPIAVPEPSTYAMALAGLACGGYSMFRRRRAR